MKQYLGGAVQVQRLERTTDGTPFMAEDARGAVAWPLIGEAFEHLHVAEFARRGVRRGFHAHPRHAEHFLVFRGELRLAVRAEGCETVVRLSAGDLVRLNPGVAHALESQGAALSIHYGRGSDPLGDTVRVSDLVQLLDREVGEEA